MSRNNSDDNKQRDNARLGGGAAAVPPDNGGLDGWGVAGIVGGVIGGIAAIAGGIYLLNNKKEDQPPSVTTNQTSSQTRRQVYSRNASSSSSSSSAMSDLLSSMMEKLNTANGNVQPNGASSRRGVPISSVPRKPVINNLNALLNDVYVRNIALRDQDFEEYYNVMHKIFYQLHMKMKEVDPYYRRYSSTVKYAGSHPDRLRINKPDEFDVDIVVGLPVSFDENCLNSAETDIVIEPKDPGFVQLKMGVQFQRLPMRDGNDWQINKAAYEWKDEKNYLLRSNFMNWWKSVVNRALDTFKPNRSSEPLFYVDNVPYTIGKSESGPAMTIFVKNPSRNFKIDVDLVPAIRFPITRWPVCSQYRSIPIECRGNPYWMVVPKPNKAGQNDHDKNRSWRVAMHEQEAMLMHDTNNMRQAIRLLKKFRDAQGMTKIASYYIKTLFFWEAIDHLGDRGFWNNNPAYLFKVMLKNFHEALVIGKIPYFWSKTNNLIGHVDRATLNKYASIVAKLLAVMDQPSQYKEVAKFLLNKEEYREYSTTILNKL